MAKYSSAMAGSPAGTLGSGMRGAGEPGPPGRGRRRTAEREHLGRLPLHLEVEGELSRLRRQAGTEHRPERDASLQFRVDLPDDGDAPEADAPLAADGVRRLEAGRTSAAIAGALRGPARSARARLRAGRPACPPGEALDGSVMFTSDGSPRERYPSDLRVSIHGRQRNHRRPEALDRHLRGRALRGLDEGLGRWRIRDRTA